jgi:hypothetical protein
LIPIGITVLSAPENDLSEIRRKGLEGRCDVVDFPREGQQTTNYKHTFCLAHFPVSDSSSVSL